MTLIGFAGNIIWSCIFITFIAIKCYMNQVTSDASRLGDSLTRLLFSRNEKLKMQAKSFYLSLCYEKYTHWPLAFFQLDLKLLFSVSYLLQSQCIFIKQSTFFSQALAAIASYIVILVQFDLSQKSSDDDDELLP